MSIFNSGYVQGNWCKTVVNSQVSMATNHQQYLECTSRLQQIPYESIYNAVSDHDYAAVMSPLEIDEASSYRQDILRTKMCRRPKSQHQREYKPYWKRRVVHVNLTTEQIVSLEEVFQRKPYITLQERISLSGRLQIDINDIKNWFRNRRQSTNRLELHDCIPDMPLLDESSYTNSDRLALIELKIIENTDINGFVTLDDDLMNDLVEVINECLSKKVDSQLGEVHPTEIRCYEPVSPAASEDLEDTAPWQNLDPEENLQRLMDIQAILCKTAVYI